MPDSLAYIKPDRASPLAANGSGPRISQSEAKPNNDRKKQWEFPPQRELWLLFVLRGAGKEGVYGLAIKEKIEESSNGSATFSVGSLYSLLKRLRRKGLVDSYEGGSAGGGGKRQYYFITEDGLELLGHVDNFLSGLQSGDCKD